MSPTFLENTVDKDSRSVKAVIATVTPFVEFKTSPLSASVSFSAQLA